MTDPPKLPDRKQQMFFMDLLSHDILNSNQAVLSYLELLLSTRDLPPKVRSYAEKAISHVRASTVMVENSKRLNAALKMDPNELQPLDLVFAIDASARELVRFFPDKRIKVDVKPGVRDALVIGNSLAQDLVMNVMLNTVRMDPSEDISITVSVEKSKLGDRPSWSVVVRDRTCKLPDVLKGGDLTPIFSQDSSKTVRMAGLLFAKMIAEILGGKFETASGPSGAELTLTLLKAGD